MLDITHLCYSVLAHSDPSSQGLEVEQGDVAPASHLPSFSPTDPKPLVVWQVTRSCNLNCLDCHSDSRPRRYAGELNTRDALTMIDDLANYGVSQLHFAGGEPLLRGDLLELVFRARQRGIQPSLITNGTALTPECVTGLKQAGIKSVSILLEGIGQGVDGHRGVRGAFTATLQGYWSCQAAGLASNFHVPLNRWTYRDIEHFFLFFERARIRHVVFEHLVYAGRGNNPEKDLTHEETRRALDLILERTEDFVRRGLEIRIETSQNYVDGVYLYLQLMRKHPWRASGAHHLLRPTDSALYGAGVGLASIDPAGDVHPDPHWTSAAFGNVRSTPFSEIWAKSTDTLLTGLRDRMPRLKGRCADCRWKRACGGSLRVRAEEVYGDPWMHDPACYLTQLEIKKEIPAQFAAMENEMLLPEQAA
jgi:radical SAM protein with 4Fe4S-binding SPASM domain